MFEVDGVAEPVDIGLTAEVEDIPEGRTRADIQPNDTAVHLASQLREALLDALHAP